MELAEDFLRFLAPGADRLVALAGMLAKRSLPYSILPAAGARHVLVRLGEGRPALVLCAHYDRVEGSPGYLDNSAACLALADFGAYNMTTRTFDEELAARDWYCDSFTTYCDPAGGERIQEITGGVKANNAVDSGIDYLCAKIERNEFYVSRRCSGVLSEIWDYCRDEDGEIVKVNDHFMDALRYAAFSAAQDGVVLV